MSITHILPTTQLPGTSKAPADKHGVSTTAAAGKPAAGQAPAGSFSKAIARVPGQKPGDGKNAAQDFSAAEAIVAELTGPQPQLNPLSSALAQTPAWSHQLVAEAATSSESGSFQSGAELQSNPAMQLIATSTVANLLTAAAADLVIAIGQASPSAEVGTENAALAGAAQPGTVAKAAAATDEITQLTATGTTAQVVVSAAGDSKADAGHPFVQRGTIATASTAAISTTDLAALTAPTADTTSLESTASTLARIGDAGQAALRMSTGPEIPPIHGSAGQPGSALSGASTTATLNTASPQLSAPLSSPQWGGELGRQLVNISRRGEQRVSLNLNPVELGPLTVELKVMDQVAQLQFLSNQPQVRQAVEQAIPQLREALAEQGISLGETSVGEQRTAREQFAQNGDGALQQGAGAAADNPAAGNIAAEQMTTLSATPGRINLYV